MNYEDALEIGEAMGMSQAAIDEALGVPAELDKWEGTDYLTERPPVAPERPDGAQGVPGRAGGSEGDGGHGEDTEDTTGPSRRVDLGPFLDGSYEPPKPEVGEYRDDGTRMLYGGRWHSLNGMNEAGKTFLACWHAAQELKAGNVVVYLHFEEPLPGGTIARLQQLGVPPEVIRERFVWLDCGRQWKAVEYIAELASLPVLPTLVVLDGQNAACTMHSTDPERPAAVGWYRRMFVTPATRLEAAVLSLGHPPKARDRQDERHGFGSTAWLDEVDGVGFRLLASKTPIRKGQSGSSALYVVKDRYGEVKRHGVPDGRRDGWFYFGQFVVDSTDPRWLTVRLTTPEKSDDGPAKDAIDRLGDEVVRVLSEQEGQRAGSQSVLAGLLRARKVSFAEKDLAPALLRLVADGRVVWPEAAKRGQGRPVWLPAETPTSSDSSNLFEPLREEDGTSPPGTSSLFAPFGGEEVRGGAGGSEAVGGQSAAALWSEEVPDDQEAAVGAADALVGTGCQHPGCDENRVRGEQFCDQHKEGDQQ